MYEKIKSVQGWSNKVKVLLYGPGWLPGTPRLGLPQTPDSDVFPIEIVLHIL